MDLLLHVTEIDILKVQLWSWCPGPVPRCLCSSSGATLDNRIKKDRSFSTVITLTHPQIVQCCPFLHITMSIRSVPDHRSRQQAPLQELEPCWFSAAGTKSALFMPVHCGALAAFSQRLLLWSTLINSDTTSFFCPQHFNSNPELELNDGRAVLQVKQTDNVLGWLGFCLRWSRRTHGFGVEAEHTVAATSSYHRLSHSQGPLIKLIDFVSFVSWVREPQCETVCRRLFKTLAAFPSTLELLQTSIRP